MLWLHHVSTSWTLCSDRMLGSALSIEIQKPHVNDDTVLNLQSLYAPLAVALVKSEPCAE